MKKIAFFGTGGSLGKPVLDEFINAGYAITALSPDAELSQKIYGDTINWIPGDLRDKEAIDKVIESADVIYLNLSVDRLSTETDFQPEREGLKEILTAAKWAAAPRIVYLSSLVQRYQGMNGFYWWVFEIKNDAVDKIKRSGIPYIIFYPSTFMESFLSGAFAHNNKILTPGKSKYANWLVSSADYARWVVEAVEKTPEGEDREYAAQGPEGFTVDKAAEEFVKSLPDLRLKRTAVPMPAMKLMAAFDKKLRFTARYMEAVNNFPEKFMAEATWEELSKPKTAFKDFIQKHQPRKAKNP